MFKFYGDESSTAYTDAAFYPVRAAMALALVLNKQHRCSISDPAQSFLEAVEAAAAQALSQNDAEVGITNSQQA